MKEIGLKIQALRKSRGLSQDEIAAKSGISRTIFQKIEGGTGNPTIETLAAISEVLDAPIASFLGDETTPLPDLSAAARILENLSSLDMDFQRIVLSLILGDVSYMQGRPSLAVLIPKVQALLKIRS